MCCPKLVIGFIHCITVNKGGSGLTFSKFKVFRGAMKIKLLKPLIKKKSKIEDETFCIPSPAQPPNQHCG